MPVDGSHQHQVAQGGAGMMVLLLSIGLGTWQTQHHSNAYVAVLTASILRDVFNEPQTRFSQNCAPTTFGLPGRAIIVNDELNISPRDAQLR